MLAAVISVGCIAAPVSIAPIGIVAEAATTKSLSAPENISGKVSKDSIILTWDKVEGADGYRVYMYNPETKKYEKYKSVSGTKCTVKSLKSGKTYYFKVATLTKSGKKYVRNGVSSKVAVKFKASKTDKSVEKTKTVSSWNDIASYGFVVSKRLDSGKVNYKNENSDAIAQFYKFTTHLYKDCKISYASTIGLDMELGELRDADDNLVATVFIDYTAGSVLVMGVPEK